MNTTEAIDALLYHGFRRDLVSNRTSAHFSHRDGRKCVVSSNGWLFEHPDGSAQSGNDALALREYLEEQ